MHNNKTNMDAQIAAQTTKMLSDLALIRSKAPLIHNITNFVAMNPTANALLAIGASPIMAQAIEEVDQMVSISSSLVLNIGTISVTWMESMIKAGQAAILKKIPIIFDPVGAGATDFRTIACNKIITTCNPTIIRGNASEIVALNDNQSGTKGVDSTISSDAAVEAAKALAIKTKSIVVVSGVTDYMTDGTSVNTITFGSTMMARVTGMGCTSSAIVGAFAAINPNMLEAATNAMMLMGMAGQLAAQYSKGNGSLQINFLDELYNFDDKSIARL